MATATKQETALVKIQSGGPLREIEDLRRRWKELEGEANLVSPVATIDTIPALHGISLRGVMIDPETNKFGQGQEVYRDARFCEQDEVALGGVALQKISAAAGVQILKRERMDDRGDPYYCEIEITIGIRDFDGVWRQVTKAKELNLRDGAPEAMKPEKKQKPGDKYATKTGRMVPLDPSALADRRRHIQSLCETKALYRGIRTILQLKQKYKKSELAKPFVVPKLVPMLDPRDPDQKQALIGMALGREASLYGNLGEGEPPRMLKDVTPEPSPATVQIQNEAPSETVPAEVSEQEARDGDFETLEFGPPPPSAVCDCPCGDQSELTEEVAQITTERCGAPRCRDCYPGRGFDVKRHEGLADLRLPKYPGLTVEQIVTAQKGGKR